MADPTGNPVIDGIIAQASANESAEDSAVIALNGVKKQIDDAVAAALAAGATAQQLAAVTQVSADLETHRAALAAAVAANTGA